MPNVKYILDTEEIVKESLSLFQHDGAAGFKLSGRSPWPPALSAKDFRYEKTQMLNLRVMWRINRHPVESNEHSAL
jgi:hypothetical protein